MDCRQGESCGAVVKSGLKAVVVAGSKGPRAAGRRSGNQHGDLR
jgi:hypothetical protein